MINVSVKTVTSGRQYRATVERDGREVGRYVLMLADNQMVSIYTKDHGLGLWRLERFGGQLSTASVRTFFLDNMKR